MEGTYVYKKDDQYYMFGSRGLYYTVDYQVVVARATELTADFMDSNFQKLSNGGGTPIMYNSQYFWGSGHNGEIFQDDNNEYWMCYHSHFRRFGNNIRPLMISNIEWVSGWPMISQGQPVIINQMPNFK